MGCSNRHFTSTQEQRLWTKSSNIAENSRSVMSDITFIQVYAVDGRLGLRLRGYHPITPTPFKVWALCALPLVSPVIFRGTPRQATWETSVSEGWNWARNGRSFALRFPLPRKSQVSFTFRKSATWDRRLYFPSEGRHIVDFFTRKIRRLRPGLNPRSWVPEASMLTTRPLNLLIYAVSTSCDLLPKIWFFVKLCHCTAVCEFQNAVLGPFCSFLVGVIADQACILSYEFVVNQYLYFSLNVSQIFTQKQHSVHCVYENAFTLVKLKWHTRSLYSKHRFLTAVSVIHMNSLTISSDRHKYIVTYLHLRLSVTERPIICHTSFLTCNSATTFQ
jgi:hypothetical protein